MSDYTGSNTPKEVRNSWATPQWLFDALNEEFRFEIDAAADSSNHKCATFFDESDNALEIDWVIDTGCFSYWLNPPYDNIKPWVTKAIKESALGATVVMLVPATPDPAWWPEQVAEVRFITKGRIHFVDPVTGKVKKGNNKPSCLLIFKPMLNNQTVTRYVPRPLLEVWGKEAANDESVKSNAA